MKKYQNILVAGAMGAVSALALPVQAQSGHDHHAAAPAAIQVAQAEMAEGEVRKIDKENKKITLKHGPLKSLDMPPMTMVFHVPDASLLEKVKVGDKVRFSAANPGGKLTVTDIQPAK